MTLELEPGASHVLIVSAIKGACSESYSVSAARMMDAFDALLDSVVR